VERAVDLGTDAVRKAVDSTTRTKSKVTYQKKEIVTEPVKNLPVLYGKTGNKTTAGIAKIVGGSLLSGVMVLTLIVSMILSFVETQVIPTVLSLTGLAGGVGLITSGVRNLNWVSRFKAYRKMLGNKTHITLEKLARGVGKNVKFVRKELEKMIVEGLFLEGHMDQEKTLLITSDETYRYFEQSRLQLEERQRQEKEAMAQRAAAAPSAQVQEVLDRGDAFIAQIRKCNDDIPGEEISEKISRMELIVHRIFDRAETNPEVIPDLKKLMDYYLPMTVKLLNAYAEMDAQPVQGQTIANSKREIEATLDTLNLAFEKLLDELFADTALDVSSDISVLQTLLAQEGLTEDGITKQKNNITLE